MRITYDFYQRCTKLPADQLAKATGMKVHLFGSLSATGKGHGTERAALAGIVGKEPATVEPEFLDGLAAKPDQTFPVKIGDKTLTMSLKDIVYDEAKGDFPHPNTMTCKLMGGDTVLHEQEYYSVGGGFIEWKGYQPPKKGQPKYPYSTMQELQAHAEKNKLSVAQLVMANEVAVSGKSEAEINAFIDKIHTAMVNIVKAGLKAPQSTLPGPIKLKTKAGDVYKRAMDDKYERQRGLGVCRCVRAGGIRGERARPSCGDRADWRIRGRHARARLRAWRGRPQSAEGKDPRRLPRRGCGRLPLQTQRDTVGRRGWLSGGNRCGVGHGRRAHRAGARLDHQVVANAAESSLQHHLGMTCDPVAGFVQVPCIERCAFGAVKAWTGFMIASNEIATNRRVDFDTTVSAMALTAKEMNSKYKETSEGGLAVSVVLC